MALLSAKKRERDFKLLNLASKQSCLTVWDVSGMETTASDYSKDQDNADSGKGCWWDSLNILGACGLCCAKYDATEIGVFFFPL